MRMIGLIVATAAIGIIFLLWLITTLGWNEFHSWSKLWFGMASLVCGAFAIMNNCKWRGNNLLASLTALIVPLVAGHYHWLQRML